METPPFPVTAVLDAAAVKMARGLVDLHLFGPWLATLSDAEREAYTWAEERHAARMRAAGFPGW